MGSKHSTPAQTAAAKKEALGGITQFPYFKVISDPDGSQEGYSKIMKSMADSDHWNLEDNPIANTWELMLNGMKNGHPKAGFGQRKKGPNPGEFGDYEWISLQEVKDQGLRLGSGLIREQLPELSLFPDEDYEPGRKLKFVGVIAQNSLEYLAVETASNAYGFTVVPTYRKMGVPAMKSIFEQTNLNLMFAYQDSIPFLLDVIATTDQFPKVFVIFDTFSDRDQSLLEGQGIRVLKFSDLISTEKENLLPPTPLPIDAIHTLSFTSGTTGVPKGVIVTPKMWIAVVISVVRALAPGHQCEFTRDTIHFSYLPIAHVFEKMVMYFCLYHGARVGFSCGDNLKILEDLSLLKPTFMPTVPRVIRRVLERVKLTVEKASPVKQKLFNRAVAVKLANFQKTGSITHSLYDKIVFSKLRALLGGNLQFAINGGAALDRQSQELFSVMFCVRVHGGYGMSETTGGACVTHADDMSSGNVGFPIPMCLARLRSVPDMDYFVTDKMPRGELMLKGPTLTPGYFMNKEATRKLFDSRGWMHTGDIAQLHPENCLRVIDRASDFFKLSNGEFVSPEKVESVYLRSRYVAQIFVHGKPSDERLVGLVVPDEEQQSAFHSKSTASTVSTEENESFKNAILNDMYGEAKAADLKPCELIKTIKIVEDPFTVENGLLTPTLKVVRTAVQKQYSSELEKLTTER